MKNLIEKRELNTNGRLRFEKLEYPLDHLVKGQEVNQEELRLGFIGLAKQNQELLDLNKELSGQQLKKVVEELDTLTKEINLVLRNLSKNLPDKPNLTTHSFRIGFISQLWRDTNDIEFVRQAIGHEKVESTSSYIENLSDEERRVRMEQITSSEVKYTSM